MLKRGFRQVMNHHGSSVLIHKNYGSLGQASREVRGLQNNEQGRPNEVIFQFEKVEEIAVGDVLQVKSGRDLWRVTETEDIINGDVLTCFEARVQKIDGESQATRPKGAFVVNGNVIGGIQIGTQNSSQFVAVNLTEIDKSIGELKKIIPQSTASELDKEEAVLALDRLATLSKKDKTDDIITRAKDKLEIVKNVIGISTELAKIATPYLLLLAEHFSK